MIEQEHIITAWNFLSDGFGEQLERDQINSALLSEENLTWVHLNAKNVDAKEWLNTHITCLDDIIIHALIEKETRPRILEFSKGILVILRGPNFNEGEDIEDMVSLRVWIDPIRIVSVERRGSEFVSTLENLLTTGKAPKNSGEFIVFLNNLLLKQCDPLITALEDEIDTADENLIDAPDQTTRIVTLRTRKKIIFLRRFLSPQRDVIFNLKSLTFEWINTRNRRLLHEQFNRAQRLVETLDLMRERTQIINDELSNLASTKMNKNLYILSIITSIFLPLSFLTGLFGINVAGIPGASYPLAFWSFSGILFIIVLVMVLSFKIKKWF